MKRRSGRFVLERFYHSVCVSREVECLATVRTQCAHLAGILHDNMKDLPRDEQLKIDGAV